MVIKNETLPCQNSENPASKEDQNDDSKVEQEVEEEENETLSQDTLHDVVSVSIENTDSTEFESKLHNNNSISSSWVYYYSPTVGQYPMMILLVTIFLQSYRQLVFLHKHLKFVIYIFYFLF